MTQFQTVCQTDDIPAGQARLFVVDEVMVGLFHLDGQFFALDNLCPHAGASLAHGIIEGETVIEYSDPSIGGERMSSTFTLPDDTPLREGYIALQAESHPIEFRRVELVDLSGAR